MKSNRLIFDEYLSVIKRDYGEKIIVNAVKDFEENDILIEGQYPFLNDASMRERNYDVQMEILRTYGFNGIERVLLGAFEVPNEGWMHCFYILGGRFTYPEEVRIEVIRFFSL